MASAHQAFFDHSTAKRVSTDAVIARALTQQYPQLELVIIPAQGTALFAYAQAGNATLTPIAEEAADKDGSGALPSSLSWERYVAPSKRINGDRGALVIQLLFGKYRYRWQGTDFLVYYANGRDGVSAFPPVENYYLLTSPADRPKADSLVVAAGFWNNQLHDEVLVFDQGWWNKSRELYDSIRGASWDSVILNPDMKKTLIEDHMYFFKSRASYQKFKVPWKRGIIYYGPPGNGKTISIKATMNMLYHLKDPVPTLYVRSLASFGGPEYSLAMIFSKARETAPCYLVLEDLDSLVTDAVRSYFLNEVDGLKNNDGIFIIGSTNHLDRLDPGLSKRPSRFDRKYLFPDPDLKERVAYCRFWQRKLADNKDVEFPDELCDAVAEITDKFSFSYIQEAFVAALLTLARRSGEDEDDEWVTVSSDAGDADGDDDSDSSHEDLEKLPLWLEIRRQVKILRESLGSEDDSTVESPLSTAH